MANRLNSTSFSARASIFAHLCEKYGLTIDEGIALASAENRLYGELTNERAGLLEWARSFNDYGDGIKRNQPAK